MSKKNSRNIHILPSTASEMCLIVAESLDKCLRDPNVKIDLCQEECACITNTKEITVNIVGAILKCLFPHVNVRKTKYIGNLENKISDHDQDCLYSVESLARINIGGEGVYTLSAYYGISVDLDEVSEALWRTLPEDHITDVTQMIQWARFLHKVLKLREDYNDEHNFYVEEYSKEINQCKLKDAREAADLIGTLLALSTKLERIKCLAELGKDPIMVEIEFLAFLEQTCETTYEKITNGLSKLSIDDKIERYEQAIKMYILNESVKPE